MAGPENRKEQRVPLAAKVQIKTEGLEKFIEKFSGNISKGGIFIKTPTALPLGKEVILTVVVPGGTQLIEARGKVAWVRATKDPVTGEPPGMGIQFDSLSEGSEAVLDQVLQGAKRNEFAGEAIEIPVDADPEPAPAPAPTPAPAPAPAPAAAAPEPAKPPAPPAPAPPAAPTSGPSLDTTGLDALLGDIEDALGEKPMAGSAAPTAETLARGMSPGARPESAAPSPPAAPAAAPAPAAPAASASPSDGGGLEGLMDDIDEALVESPMPPAGAPAPAAPAPATAGSGTAGSPAPASRVVLGIDLGTTYSCAAYVKPDGSPEVIPTDSGYRTIPSVVTINGEEQIVGRAAYDRIATHPKNTIYGSKRLLGRKFISRAVQDARKYFDYEIVGDENGNAAVRVDGEIYPLGLVSARILEEIRNWARVHLKEDARQAVICVPAYYNDTQRAQVIEAGRAAGFEVKRIVNEPVAAALAYGFDRALQQKLFVYDLGGGTFDVSVMELTGNVFDVVAAGGDPYLGGVDFDNRIVDHLVLGFKNASGVDIESDKVAILRLRAAAESAKRDLSEKNEVRIQLPYLARTAAGGVASLDLTLTRADLERIVKELVDRTVHVCEEVLAAAGVEKSAIDAVLLVGGQTRMPMIQAALTEFFGKAPRKGVHPDEAVAMGAALLAASMERVDSVVLLDVVSMSIGIGIPGGEYRPVLMRNTKLPAGAATTVSTTKDGQTGISVDVFQGDTAELSQNDYLGTIELEGFPPAPAGHFNFEISFRMDAQGFLTVIATERTSGLSQQMILRTRETPEALAAAIG